MKSRLTVVMDNGDKYTYHKILEINEKSDFEKNLKSMGFVRDRDVTDRDFVIIGLVNGNNVIINEDKISSFEFINIIE